MNQIFTPVTIEFSSGLSGPLLHATILTSILGTLILARFVGWHFALFLSVSRSAINMVYWAWFTESLWWLHSDSEKYIRAGVRLFERWEIAPNFIALVNYAKTFELPAAYALHNFFAFKMFGEQVYSPIFVNTLIIFVSVVLIFYLFPNMLFSVGRRRAFAVFFIFHWNLIQWSAVNNTKEIFVIFLVLSLIFLVRVALQKIVFLIRKTKEKKTVSEKRTMKDGTLAILSPRRLIKNRAISNLGALVLCLGLIYVVHDLIWNTRRSLAYVLPGIILIWLVVLVLLPPIEGLFRGANKSESKRDVPKLWAIFPIVLVILGFAGLLLNQIPVSFIAQLDFEAGPGRIMRFLLTPRPWSLAPEYGFLMVGAVAHICLIGVSICGLGIMAYRERHQEGGWLLIYFICMLVIFGLAPEVAGPRHRVQIDFVLIIGQFYIGLMLITGFRGVRCTPPLLYTERKL
jgi:hypothetical protein